MDTLWKANPPSVFMLKTTFVSEEYEQSLKKIESGFIRHRLKKDLSKHDYEMSSKKKHF